jgi:hypothetical protein
VSTQYSTEPATIGLADSAPVGIAESLSFRELIQLHPAAITSEILALTPDRQIMVLQSACRGAGKYAESGGDHELADFWFAVSDALASELRLRQGDRT